MELKNLKNIFHYYIILRVIILLNLAYWSLYKIVKDYSRSNYNKTEGFLLANANNKTIFEAQAYIFYIWLNIFKAIYKAFGLIPANNIWQI
jgi:hypothetical protein